MLQAVVAEIGPARRVVGPVALLAIGDIVAVRRSLVALIIVALIIGVGGRRPVISVRVVITVGPVPRTRPGNGAADNGACGNARTPSAPPSAPAAELRGFDQRRRSVLHGRGLAHRRGCGGTSEPCRAPGYHDKSEEFRSPHHDGTLHSLVRVKSST